jgi:hypothetical protein
MSSNTIARQTPAFGWKTTALRAGLGRVDDDLFIIKFLPIYLADSARASLDNLPRNMIDS